MSWSATDAVEYKGFPADKSRTGGWISAALSLGMQEYSSYVSLQHVVLVDFNYAFKQVAIKPAEKNIIDLPGPQNLVAAWSLFQTHLIWDTLDIIRL
ncbi:hypothetical protein SLA2020_176100 [Shorea laevis]